MWDYRGIKEQLEKIKKADFRKAYKALKGLDNTITALLAEDSGNTYLMSYRRQVRMALRAYR